MKQDNLNSFKLNIVKKEYEAPELTFIPLLAKIYENAELRFSEREFLLFITLFKDNVLKERLLNDYFKDIDEQDINDILIEETLESTSFSSFINDILERYNMMKNNIELFDKINEKINSSGLNFRDLYLIDLHETNSGKISIKIFLSRKENEDVSLDSIENQRVLKFLINNLQNEELQEIERLLVNGMNLKKIKEGTSI